MEHGCGTWQWSRYIEIMMYLSSTITLIISHLQGIALRSEQIRDHTLSPCIVLMKVHRFLPLRIALTPLIPRVYRCLQILILFSLTGEKKIQNTEHLGTPNIMSKEIVTYKPAGPFLMNVKPGLSLHRTADQCPKITAMHHLSTLHSHKAQQRLSKRVGGPLKRPSVLRRRGPMAVSFSQREPQRYIYVSPPHYQSFK